MSFAKPKRKNFRRRRESDDNSEEEDVTESLSNVLEETKESQKFRKRQTGVSAAGLAFGKKVISKNVIESSDPFKMETGGLIDIYKIKDRNRDRTEDADRDVGDMGSTFAAETNRRDEDAEMMKYIETELAKKKGVQSMSQEKKEKVKTAEEKLFELPDNLKVNSQKKTEEMLSNQMLSGIPEVDLGIDVKIRNIEATEDAKSRIIAEQLKKDKDKTSFAPTNMAVNYVQHSRYNIDQHNVPKQRKKKEEEAKPKPVVVLDPDMPESEDKNSPSSKRKLPKGDKATDDYHFERFRKATRRF